MAVTVEIHPQQARGARALVQWILLLPMLLMAGILTAAATLITVPIAVSVLARRRVPPRLAAFQVWVIRQRVRTFSAFWLLRTDIPPWPRQRSAHDPGDDPLVTVSASPPLELPRSALITSPLRVVAHLLVLLPIAVILDLLYPVWMLLVAVRGWSGTARARLVTVEQWTADVLAHAWLVSEDSPRPRWAELRQSSRVAEPTA